MNIQSSISYLGNAVTSPFLRSHCSTLSSYSNRPSFRSSRPHAAARKKVVLSFTAGHQWKRPYATSIFSFSHRSRCYSGAAARKRSIRRRSSSRTRNRNFFRTTHKVSGRYSRNAYLYSARRRPSCATIPCHASRCYPCGISHLKTTRYRRRANALVHPSLINTNSSRGGSKRWVRPSYRRCSARVSALQR